ncbi:MAG: methyl-accepting chemotaxis protein [Spirochaetia bacterium]
MSVKSDGSDKRFKNFSDALSKFVVGYNKSVVLNTITLNTMDIADGKLQYVQNSLGDVVATFEEIQATSQNTSSNTESINKQMSSIVDKNNSVGEELSIRINEITDARKDSHKLNSLFQELIGKSKEIKEITSAIQDVSDRTNVLSINASIEAARAGEAGKGFRIIAGEVKDLAQQTNSFAETIENRMGEFAKAVEDISEYVQKFTGILDSFTDDIERIRTNFEENRQESDAVGDGLKEIAAASSEETQAIHMGLNALEETFDGLKDASAVIEGLKKSYEGLSDLLNREE